MKRAVLASLSLLAAGAVLGTTLPAQSPASAPERRAESAVADYATIRDRTIAAGTIAAATTSAGTVAQAGLRRTSASQRILGRTRSGLPWHSGVWVGGRFSPLSLDRFGAMRGRPVDIVTTYSDRASFGSIADNSWSIDVWKGFGGTLNYGLSILPDNGAGSLRSIARGDQDRVWRSVARNLARAGRGDAIVRIGWEANLHRDWRWAVDAKHAKQYRAAFRRVAKVLNRTSPGLKIDFGVGCGNGLDGSSDRLAALQQLYPGDDVVDIVSCDVYDWWSTRVRSTDRTPVTRPRYGPGLADLAGFARRHGKGVGIGEWGLARKANGRGGGDNPKFVRAIRTFLQRNTDVVTYECYFDEPAGYLRSSLLKRQNHAATNAYRALW